MATGNFRVVLDTNEVVGAGTGWMDHGTPMPDPNTCRRVLIRVAESHKGLYCGKIVGEYIEKLLDLNHPPHRALRLITYLIGAFEMVLLRTSSAPSPPSDPDDEVFILCALDGKADYLVSEDGSLLALKPSYKIPIIGKSADLALALGA